MDGAARRAIRDSDTNRATRPEMRGAAGLAEHRGARRVSHRSQARGSLAPRAPSLYLRRMRVTLLLFASYRDLAGRDEFVLELPAGATAGRAVEALRERGGALAA